jgi:argininosuccinate lyase
MSALWSGRFDQAPDADLLAFGASFPFDRRLFEEDVRGSLAWAEALERAGVLDAVSGAAIRQGLTEILQRATDDPEFLRGADEDVHSFVERELVARIGDAGRRLHTGRSRNEQVSLDLRLFLGRQIPALQERVRGLVAALAGLAEAAGDTLVPAYTHMRRAQPVLLAHFCLAHAAALQRDHGRLAAARGEADALPLGSGAVAGTAYAIDTAALAARLGFSRVVANSLDAASDRDFVSTFLHACALAMVHLSRMAEDLILFTAEEFGFLDLPDALATGSSLMPQKKNPDPLELIRGKAGRTIGHAMGWLATLKGLPSGYNKDLQEDKEPVFDATDTLGQCLAAMTIVVPGLRVNRPACERAAAGLLLATDVADALVSRGVPFRTAHEIVGGLVRRLLSEGRDFEALAPDDWRRVSDAFADGPPRIDPRASVEAKRTPQSTNPEAVRAALAGVRAWLENR